MRYFLPVTRPLLTIGIVVAMWGACVVQGQAEPAARPNIVFVLIDDLRSDTFGFAGHRFIQTPHLDRLVREGVHFSNAFVTTSLCSPSRASFLSGLYMHHHRVVDNNDLMSREVVTFPKVLQASGYRTAFVGKWHMGGSSDQRRPGFDHWVSFRGQGTYWPKNQKINVNGERVARSKYMTDELTDYAQAWLSRRRGDEPFMLMLSHKGVHGLYDPAPRHLDRYQTQPWKPPVSFLPDARGYSKKPMWVRDQRNSWHGVEFPYHGRSGQSIEEMYKHYCEMILSIDDSVGRIIETLKATEQADNTILLFTSDGGHLWGEHGLIDKRCAYEASIKIPLIAWGPSHVAAGSRCDALVANIDLAPTIVELAKAETQVAWDGKSFARLLNRPEQSKGFRDRLLYQYYWEPNFPQTPTTFALRTREYKLIQYHGLWDIDELYDLQNDPQELNNLIDVPEHKQRIAEMRQQLHQELKDSGGLVIPLGFKRGHGANLRRPDGSRRSSFPDSMKGE